MAYTPPPCNIAKLENETLTGVVMTMISYCRILTCTVIITILVTFIVIITVTTPAHPATK